MARAFSVGVWAGLRRFLFVMLAWGMAGAVLPADEQVETGDWGDPRRLQVTGVQQLNADRILEAIGGDLDLAWQSHPRNPLPNYLAALQRRVLFGVQRAGFPQGRVEVTTDSAAQRVRLQIFEGPRFRAGEVAVAGCAPEVARQLAAWMKAPRIPADAFLRIREEGNGRTSRQWIKSDGSEVDLENPLWVPGAFAPFDEPTRTALEREAQRGLASAGWTDALFTVAVAPSRQPGVAQLVIDVLELGEPARVKSIKVEGNERDTRDEILAFLGLELGQTFTQERRAECDERLRASGRFRKYNVEYRARFGGDGVEVTVAVVDYAPAPRLSQPLRREQQALLRCREWILNHGARGEELVVRRHGDQVESISVGEVVVSPAQGMLIRLIQANGKELSVCFGAGEWGMYCSHGDGALAIPWTRNEQVRGAVHFSLNPDPVAPKPHHFRLGYGVRSADSNSPRPPFALDLVLDPAAMLALLEDAETRATFRDSELTVSSPKHFLRVDSETGRVFELRLLFDSKTSWTLTCERDYLAKRLAQIRREAGPNRYSPARPVSAVAEFFTSPPLVSLLEHATDHSAQAPGEPSRWKGMAAAVRSVTMAGCLEPLDRLAVDFYDDLSRDDHDRFVIPMPEAEAKALGVPKMIGAGAMIAIDRLSGRETWVATLPRALAAAYAQEGRYAQLDLQQLSVDPQFGPVGHLLAASFFPHPATGHWFARRGLDRLDLNAFHADRDQLLRVLARTQADQKLVQIARRISPADAAALGQNLWGDPEALVAACHDLRQAADDRAAMQRLPVVLDRLWQQRLGALVEERLRAQLGEQASRR